MSESIVGRTFGPYRVLSPLGKGGMGEVYIATDERLHRRVALKFLPEAAQENAASRTRFLAEARAISALQHPNIVTIFDIGEAGGRSYFAMELLDGEPLRSLLRRGPLPVDKAVKLAADVAGAIAAAHAAGVVHRDLKPENIVVLPSGDAKVLDYGLAKMLPVRQASEDSSTMEWSPTAAGAIVGTVAYMSPEQASGAAVDHRTDLFSLGAVLYEMLTGRQPFSGKSTVEQLHNIISTEPQPARELNSSLPAALQEVLDKCLAKDPAWRYAAAADVRLDLLRSRQAVQVEAKRATGDGRFRMFPAFALLAASLLATIALILWTGRAGSRQPSLDVRLTPLTYDEGYEGEPTFAPDGQTIAYVSDRSGNFEIYLKQVSGGPDINITNDPADDVQPSFSPDGKEIAFVSSRNSRLGLVYRNPNATLLGGDIWVMPTFGGMPRKIAEGNHPRWSPDGKSLIFIAGNWSAQKIYRISSRGGAPAEIPVQFEKPPLFLFYPSWSPDGKWILFAEQSGAIDVIPAAGGKPSRIATGRSPIWNSRGTAVIYCSTDPARNDSLWITEFDPATGKGGSGRPLTIGRGRDMQPAITSDGKTLAFAAFDVTFNIERVAFDAEGGEITGEPEPLTRGRQTSFFYDVSPDGKSIVYQSLQAGASRLWRKDEGKAPVQLTSDEEMFDRFPAWSPDGQWIAFSRQRDPGENPTGSVYLMRPDGSDPRRIFDGQGFLAWSPDSRGIAFYRDGKTWQFDTKTQRTTVLTGDLEARTGVKFSPDGAWLVYQAIGTNGSTDVRAASLRGEAAVEVFSTSREDYHPFFSPSGRWAYAGLDHKNLFRVPGPAQGWRKASPQQVTFFPESNLFLEEPKISLDGRWLYYSRGRITSDLWLMRVEQGTF